MNGSGASEFSPSKRRRRDRIPSPFRPPCPPGPCYRRDHAHRVHVLNRRRQAAARTATTSAALFPLAHITHLKEPPKKEQPTGGELPPTKNPRAKSPVKSLSENRRGLAHFAMPCEHNVPVPFSAIGFRIGPKSGYENQAADRTTRPNATVLKTPHAKSNWQRPNQALPLRFVWPPILVLRRAARRRSRFGRRLASARGASSCAKRPAAAGAATVLRFSDATTHSRSKPLRISLHTCRSNGAVVSAGGQNACRGYIACQGCVACRWLFIARTGAGPKHRVSAAVGAWRRLPERALRKNLSTDRDNGCANPAIAVRLRRPNPGIPLGCTNPYRESIRPLARLGLLKIPASPDTKEQESDQEASEGPRRYSLHRGRMQDSTASIGLSANCTTGIAGARTSAQSVLPHRQTVKLHES